MIITQEVFVTQVQASSTGQRLARYMYAFMYAKWHKKLYQQNNIHVYVRVDNLFVLYTEVLKQFVHTLVVGSLG